MRYIKKAQGKGSIKFVNQRCEFVLIVCTLLFSLGLPQTAYAKQLPDLASLSQTTIELHVPKSLPEVFSQSRAMVNDVLDTYLYFYCYADSSHDIPEFLPTYKQLVFTKSYTRIYPDEQLDVWLCPCPFDPQHTGEMHLFKCNYKLIS